ncbi:ABC branched chain amino acid family transporter, periplasmic ligand binding protein [Delftia acidovorans SPH-1]|uniref:ABC branched chain amino acid family transporter, periplasmic ligand binding protein n=1 Tax=Delftia acidovorans (strain DSM 14801 / SPH-1) TaxID=398578 RepID=A9C008_DELAS|nr:MULTISPECIES: transporter substrate-binding domain-containing protein [Delftia]MCP4020114.1 transporter substrate-binding domain-containing protein [Delftia sp.]OLE93000.1 MAG: amino acid ABC transporter substrate-binding protein [Delftia sp. 13_1_40CM_3_66_6]ABX36270.1 ABC branched chain amino acid family transporter, periplasmic ligand binding protein [Delftia acidovorans SPH-1]MCP4534695.1 transporter substrate-binding domain-containing protein [Delftia sp.]OLE09418.1 MAG: amino acid ABC
MNDPVRVGILYSATGTTSTIGQSQLQGAQLAIDEINETGGLLGRELVAVRYDPASTPARYAALAEQLIVRDGINVIFGCYMSSSRKAVIPIVEKWNKLLFYPTLYEGFEFSGNVIYTGAAPNQNSVQLADYMTSSFGARVYLIGSDYIYPYESNRIMGELVMQHPGSDKLGEHYLPLDATERDYAAIMQDIRARQPDFIFSTVVGDSTASLYRAYADAGFNPQTMPIASLTTSEAEIAQMGADVAAGHFTAAPYFQSIDSPANARCLARLRQRLGDDCRPNLCWEAAYFQMHLFANAFRQAGSDRIGELLPHLLGSEFDAPQGRIRLDPDNHHTWLHPRVGRANAQGGFTIVRQATRAVSPDPYLVTHSLGDWTASLGALEN